MQIEGAYKMLDDLGKLNLKPSPGMYNAILEECFREVLFLVTEDASVFARIDFELFLQ